ncbi:hypothetical protein ACMDCT_02295 [Halomonadaceae bacterium KBTZ08]
MRTLKTWKVYRWLAPITMLPLVASTVAAESMAAPDSDADNARAQEQQKTQRTTQPLSLKIQQEEGVRTPRRGEHMDSVQSRFGAPQSRQGPVGEPPITRWHYPDFVVVFENEWVIDSVVEPDSVQ